MNGILSPYQRLIFGCVENGVYSTVALLEAVVLYYYNTKLNVRLEYLGLSSFVIGTLAAFVAVIAGNVSDRSKFPSRRKAYLLLFGPLYGAGLCLRYGAFTSQEQAPLYYVVTFALQVAGYTGQAVVMQAWGVELVSDVGERSMLYAYTTGCSFGGVFAGLVLANFPLQLSAFIVPCILAVGISLCVFHLPDSTPLSKRAFVPTMTNVSSVFWNSQFMVYLVASSFVAFINTLPSLVMFFIRYCVGIGTTNLTKYYSACIGAFGVMGIAGLPLIKGIVEKHGTLSCVKSCLAVAAAMGLAVLGCSYVSIYLIIACFGIIGLFSTMANVVLAIIYAQSIDYDELLCGKKRASSYSGVHTPIRIFIQIAGASVPLVLMSAVGFQSSDGSDDASSSTASASLVLRLWCSVFMTCCMVAAYVAISYFKVSNCLYWLLFELVMISFHGSGVL
jgi:Na+/melibiose symporter-like transporter